MPEIWDRIDDIVIVGSGYVGLASAIEAHDAGVEVVILEKRSSTGGNSLLSGGGANAVDPERQVPQGIEDSIDFHFTQTFEGGNSIGDPEKIKFFIDNALEGCIHWLEELGIEWPQEVTWGYGALWYRTHHPPRYKNYWSGAAIVKCLLDHVEKRKIPLLLEHKVTRIIRENPLEGRVLGVEVEKGGNKLYFRARKAVILASGGFAADLEMVKKHDRRFTGLQTSNHPEATGECIKYAIDIGSDTLHMDYIQSVTRKPQASYKARWFRLRSSDTSPVQYQDGSQTIRHDHSPTTLFVNKNGKRFVNEDARRDAITFAALKQPAFSPLPQAEANTIEELEEKLKIPNGNLVETIRKYNSYCDEKNDREFGKHPLTLNKLITPPFIAECRTLARHHTMGGLKVKGITGQVIDRYGEVIPGFYAAGEVTGGIHGANRLGYNATSSCIIFGRAVGKEAVKEILQEIKK